MTKGDLVKGMKVGFERRGKNGKFNTLRGSNFQVKLKIKTKFS